MLWAKLESGEHTDDPPAFHTRCLGELERIRQGLNLPHPPPLDYLQGLMYDRVERCLHRFDTASV